MTELQIPAAAVVPGDLLVLAEGDLVAADGEVIESAALLVDESSLTGESVPVDKTPAAADPAARMVSAGTVVVRGRARVVASATGQDSATGRLAALLTVEAPATPLQRRLRGLSRMLAAVSRRALPAGRCPGSVARAAVGARGRSQRSA